MSGHLRCRLAAFLLLAGLSTSPAYSNPFAALINAAPGDATAPAPAEEACLPQPGKSTADGRHWVYRFDGHRKCWFQAAEGAAGKKPMHHPAAKQRVAAPEENGSAVGNQKAIARAELLHSAPAETSQPTPPARELNVAAPVPAMGAAALVPSTPVVANPSSDQFTPDHPTPRQVDVETLLAAAPSPSDTVASSVPSGSAVAVPIAEASNDRRGWTATWLGVLLMVRGRRLPPKLEPDPSLARDFLVRGRAGGLSPNFIRVGRSGPKARQLSCQDILTVRLSPMEDSSSNQEAPHATEWRLT